MIFFIIVFIFLYNEKFNKDLPFDAGKFGTIVAILGVILNSLTIYLLYLQIQEMAEGRKSANQPDLYASSLKLESFDIPNFNYLTPDNFLPLPIFKTQIEGEAKFGLAKLNNIGLGAAKAIKVEWIFDSKKVDMVLIGKYNSINYNEIPKIDYYDFISPNSFIEISLPPHYLMMFGESCNPYLFENNEANKQKPQLEMSLEYSDIYGNKYFKKYIKVSVEGRGKEVFISFSEVTN